MVRVLGTLLMISLWALSGCSDCSSEGEEVREFLGSNKACQVDEDCAVVEIGCLEYSDPEALCGSVAIHKDAASSSEWKELSEDLYDCQEGNECRQCAAGPLIPACKAGQCGRAY
jgi:hypothetical protein